MLDRTLGQILSRESIVFAALVVVLVGVSEFGWRVGVARTRAKPQEAKDGGSVPAAVLTLLGLLLGFSFAMAVARHDSRRDLVVQEANSLSTTALRARLLPEPHAANIRRLLREYVSLRIEVHRQAEASIAGVEQHAERLTLAQALCFSSETRHKTVGSAYYPGEGATFETPSIALRSS